MEFLNPILEPLITAVLGALGTIIAGLLIVLLKRGLERLGLSLDAEREAQLEHVVRQAILRAEEYAAQALRNGLVQWTGPQKLQAVLNDVHRQRPDVDGLTVTRIVHAQLPQLGAGALAASEKADPPRPEPFPLASGRLPAS